VIFLVFFFSGKMCLGKKKNCPRMNWSSESFDDSSFEEFARERLEFKGELATDEEVARQNASRRSGRCHRKKSFDESTSGDSDSTSGSEKRRQQYKTRGGHGKNRSNRKDALSASPASSSSNSNSNSNSSSSQALTPVQLNQLKTLFPEALPALDSSLDASSSSAGGSESLFVERSRSMSLSPKKVREPANGSGSERGGGSWLSSLFGSLLSDPGGGGGGGGVAEHEGYELSPRAATARSTPVNVDEDLVSPRTPARQGGASYFYDVELVSKLGAKQGLLVTVTVDQSALCVLRGEEVMYKFLLHCIADFYTRPPQLVCGVRAAIDASDRRALHDFYFRTRAYRALCNTIQYFVDSALRRLALAKSAKLGGSMIQMSAVRANEQAERRRRQPQDGVLTSAASSGALPTRQQRATSPRAEQLIEFK
jgi:hypothetical protein